MVDVLVHDLKDIQSYATITRKRKKALDQALKARDRRCVVPGCRRRVRLEADHRHEYAKRGPTSSANLQMLCGKHHDEKTHRGARIVRTDTEWHWYPPPPKPGEPEPPPGSIPWKAPIGEHLNPFDLTDLPAESSRSRGRTASCRSTEPAGKCVRRTKSSSGPSPAIDPLRCVLPSARRVETPTTTSRNITPFHAPFLQPLRPRAPSTPARRIHSQRRARRSAGPPPEAPVRAPSLVSATMASGNERTVDAPLLGTVVRIAAGPGESFQQGQLLVVLESMKMEHVVAAEWSGSVSAVLVEVGQTVNPGDALLATRRGRGRVHRRRGGRRHGHRRRPARPGRGPRAARGWGSTPPGPSRSSVAAAPASARPRERRRPLRPGQLRRVRAAGHRRPAPPAQLRRPDHPHAGRRAGRRASARSTATAPS